MIAFAHILVAFALLGPACCVEQAGTANYGAVWQPSQPEQASGSISALVCETDNGPCHWEQFKATTEQAITATKPIPYTVVDVPAIQAMHEEEYGDVSWCNSTTSNGAVTAMLCDPHAKHKVTVDTCADKSRILLTAEDGTKHCVKFQ